MIFSYGLVLALFLLAPGLGAYAGLFFGAHRGAFRPGAPAPGSVLTLGIIVLGALFAHTLWAMICVADDLWAGAGGATLLRAVPSAYAVLSRGVIEHRASADGGIAVFLATSSGLTAAAFLLTTGLVRWAPARPFYMRLIYGWLTGLVEAADDEHVITAFVVTDIQHGPLSLGYQGSVLNMSVNADKQITAIVLRRAVAFYLKMDDAALARVTIPRDTPIAQIYLDRHQIKNIAFRVYEFED